MKKSDREPTQPDKDSWLERMRSHHIFMVVIGLWLLTPWILRWLYSDPAERGQFGDAFGALNTLYSGLAFGAVLYAIILQRRELAIQQEELRLTRDEFKKSRSATVLIEAMAILQRLRPSWHQLYGFPADHTAWSDSQKKLADEVGDGLQHIAYFCEAELLDREFIMARNAGTFAKCWRRLAPFVEDYRIQSGEPAKLADGAFQRRHLEEFAIQCEAFLRERYPRVRITTTVVTAPTNEDTAL